MIVVSERLKAHTILPEITGFACTLGSLSYGSSPAFYSYSNALQLFAWQCILSAQSMHHLLNSFPNYILPGMSNKPER